MEIIYTDIIKNWEACWQGALAAGILTLLAVRLFNCVSGRKAYAYAVFFMNGVFFYYLSYVTLFSRASGSMRAVILVPFRGYDILSGDFHFLIENVLLFIPYGILVCLTLHIYGRKFDAAMILTASFLTSAVIELLQYVFSCGVSEIEDLIANSAGAMLGYMMFKAGNAIKRLSLNICKIT